MSSSGPRSISLLILCPSLFRSDVWFGVGARLWKSRRKFVATSTNLCRKNRNRTSPHSESQVSTFVCNAATETVAQRIVVDDKTNTNTHFVSCDGSRGRNIDCAGCSAAAANGPMLDDVWEKICGCAEELETNVQLRAPVDFLVNSLPVALPI